MINRLPVTDALAAVIATGSGKPCGRNGTVPYSGGNPVQPPYTLLYALTGSTGGPAFADLHEDASYVYQVTAVATGGEQAEWLADRVRKTVLGRDPATGRWVHSLTVPGARCTGRRIETEPGATTSPEDAIMTYVIQFRLDFTTA